MSVYPYFVKSAILNGYTDRSTKALTIKTSTIRSIIKRNLIDDDFGMSIFLMDDVHNRDDDNLSKVALNPDYATYAIGKIAF